MTLLLSFCFLVLGAVSGSFAGVIAERSYTGQSWKGGRSRCNACTRTLSGADLVPVVSWVLSRGRCRGCRAKIPAGYVYIEILLALAFLATFRTLGLVPALLPFLLSLIALAAIILYDLRHMIVPVGFSSAFILFAFWYAVLAMPDMHALGLTLAVAGALGLILFLFYAFSGGRVMGLGDAPVAFGLSLLSGVFAVSGFLFSFWIGAAVGIIVLLRRPAGTRMGVEVPFVPFLAAGFLLAFFTQWNILPLIGF